MKDESQDFLVDIVNSQPQFSNTDIVVISVCVLLTIAGIIWLVKRK